MLGRASKSGDDTHSCSVERPEDARNCKRTLEALSFAERYMQRTQHAPVDKCASLADSKALRLS